MNQLTVQHEQVIALAGVAQTAVLINNLAQTGRFEDHDAKVLIHSLFVQNPKTTTDVYQHNLQALHTGFKWLTSLPHKPMLETTKAVLTIALHILMLQKNLAKQHELLAIINKRLSHYQEHHPTHIEQPTASTYERIASIYEDTVSTLKHRVHIIGKAEHLKQTPIQHIIRALLLAGIRSAVLWRQCGGNQWRLFWQRKHIPVLANQLMAPSFTDTQ